MKVDLNPRGNGACPFCAAYGDCGILRRLSEDIREIDPPPEVSDDDILEMVIYSCPYFRERPEA